ncbi:helix-turn-helix transcriptional regulator [Amycolatopsis sp. CA-126428]|uniref:helix-turn-helix transcriptional regulator n=1 Tax=Amycolatopsis sp. CA-126428 TaxID=2073158 RepID=UPI000CD0546E|nr:helix-turn-helix transcriptional regulator [Amycolatopsis sp. CA-126428]
MAPRQRLAKRRETLGYTQHSLAKRLRVERSTVVRWEAGSCAPQPWVRRQLAAALEISPETLDDLLADAHRSAAAETVTGSDPIGVAHLHSPFPMAPALGSEIDDMKRRELLRLFSMAGAMVAVPPLGDTLDIDRLAYATDWPGRLDDATLDEYGKLNAHLWRVFALSTSKAETLPMVRRQLDVLTGSLQHADAHAYSRLCVLAGDLFQLAGEIFFDGNAYTDAAHCYTLAASASKQAQAFDLWACALTRHAFVAVYDRQHAQAAPMLNLAATLADKGDPSLSTRYWVAAVQAETYAGLGDLTRCQQALDQAEQVQNLTGQIHTSGWLRFDGSRLAEERGTCYVTLGRPDLAEAALTDALGHDLSHRRRASVLTDLAILGAQRRDADQVLTYAGAAVDAGHRTGSGVISRKLRSLQPHLAPLMGSSKVQQLDAHINALTGHATVDN